MRRKGVGAANRVLSADVRPPFAHWSRRWRAGFGETVRSLNGALECDGGNPASVAARGATYERITGILGAAPGSRLYC
ncbi:hypothetical protein [Streptomyces atratus]|uniref:hypothetical protein n=1 Tax=Streptomyces TaxID=1883 RepID=UPI0037B3162F